MKTIFILFICLGFYITNGQTAVCSVKSGAWSDPTTWNASQVPAPADNVSISPGHTVTIDGNQSCHHLTILSGAVLSSDSLSTLEVKGNWNNSGIFLAGSGNIVLNGLFPQTLGGSSVTTFYALEINTPANVDLNRDQNIKYLLTLTQGTLSVNNKKLTLLSDSMITASIGPIPSGADIQGKISVQRYISSNITGWRFLGSPVRTTLQDWSNDFVTSGFPGSAYPNYYFCSIYGYDETVGGPSVNGYTIPSSITDSIGTGTGYWCWVGPTPKVIEVTGVPKRSAHSFNVSFTPDGGKNEDGWNMVANPYPSAIDWDAPGWTKTGIQNAIYIWDPTLDQYSAYINGISVNGGSNIIPSSQAFWVEANQGSPALACDESVKTTSQKTYVKLAPKTAIKLLVSGNLYKDETVVCFTEGASKSVLSHEDALKLFSDNPLVPSITSIADSLDLVVNAVPFDNSEVVVPVRVKVGASGMYTIKRDGDLSAPVNCCVFLEDRVTGAFVDMKSADSYSFYISDTTKAARFFLHFSKPLIKGSVNATCSYKNNGQAIATIPAMGNWTFEWKDMLGNTLTIRDNNASADTLKNLAPGYYYVTAKGKNKLCQEVSEEIEVNRAPELSVHPTITHNSCRGEKNGSIDAHLASGGTAPYYYKWSDNTYKPVLKNLNSGVYTLVLIDSQGCTDTTFHVVKTESAIEAAFTIEGDTSSITVNTPVKFVNSSSGDVSWSWNFGQESSGILHPVHTFSTPGTHTIELVVKDHLCSSSIRQVIYVKPLLSSPIKLETGRIQIYGSGDSALVKFNLDQPASVELRVQTIEGKILNSQQIQAFDNMEIVPLGESHGVYIVSVQSNTLYFQNKIIK